MDPKDTKDVKDKDAKTPAPPAQANPNGPDARTAAPVPGRPVVQTSMGPLDKETVMNNRVGGVGTVSLQHDPEETPGGAQPGPEGSGASRVGAGGSGIHEGRTTDTETTKKI